MAERKYFVFCEQNCKFESMTKEQILTAIAQAVENGTVGDIDTGFVTTVKTINGTSVKFFYGTEAEYNALSEDEKQNLYAVFTDDRKVLENAVEKLVDDLTEHTDNKDNPHEVTFEQVGAAPAGYGLGSTAPKSITDANSALRTGWYGAQDASTAQNFPSKSMAYGSLRSDTRHNVGNQELMYKGTKARRYTENSGSEWSEWEYENPQMEVGIEYRTTERWMGKAVYTKLVNCGTMPNNATKGVEIGANVNAVEIVAIATKSGGSAVHMPWLDENDGSMLARVSVLDGNAIYIVTKKDLTAYTLYVKLKYTKS